jgi:hypothetical protein
MVLKWDVKLWSGFMLLRIESINGYSVSMAKAKTKFTLEQATKAQRGSRGVVLLFL